MAHCPAVKTQGLASFGVGPEIASRGCDPPPPDIWLLLLALISPQQGVHSGPFNSSSSIITCKVSSLNQYTHYIFSQVLTFPLSIANTLTVWRTVHFYQNGHVLVPAIYKDDNVDMEE